MYNMGAEDIFSRTGVVPYKLLVEAEGKPKPGLAFCQGDKFCEKQVLDVLGVNLTTVRGFPTSMYFDGEGSSTYECGNTACGVAVRKDGDVRHCKPTNLTACGGIGNNDLSNWVCNLHTGEVATNCTGDLSTAWKRCKA